MYQLLSPYKTCLENLHRVAHSRTSQNVGFNLATPNESKLRYTYDEIGMYVYDSLMQPKSSYKTKWDIALNINYDVCVDTES